MTIGGTYCAEYQALGRVCDLAVSPQILSLPASGFLPAPPIHPILPMISHLPRSNFRRLLPINGPLEWSSGFRRWAHGGGFSNRNGAGSTPGQRSKTFTKQNKMEGFRSRLPPLDRREGLVGELFLIRRLPLPVAFSSLSLAFIFYFFHYEKKRKRKGLSLFSSSCGGRSQHIPHPDPTPHSVHRER